MIAPRQLEESPQGVHRKCRNHCRQLPVDSGESCETNCVWRTVCGEACETNHERTRCWNSFGDVLIAPQWSALATSQRTAAGLRAWMRREWRTGMLLSTWP